MIYQGPEDAAKHKEYKEALSELLFQLADDDFILSFRGSEWLGLAPHIEEDVAFSSISQDKMGHAAMYYQLLEELDVGNADYLAHARKPQERKNAILLEEVNGPGNYLSEPHYDWAFTVVRNYFYDVAKKVRLESLKISSYEPLAQVAIKINMEAYYHILHWKTWFKLLCNSTDEARNKMIDAVNRVVDEMDGVLTLGPKGNDFEKFHLIENEEMQKKKWASIMKQIFEEVDIPFPEQLGMKKGDGRAGVHTPDLLGALDTLGQVYHINPTASW